MKKIIGLSIAEMAIALLVGTTAATTGLTAYSDYLDQQVNQTTAQNIQQLTRVADKYFYSNQSTYSNGSTSVPNVASIITSNSNLTIPSNLTITAGINKSATDFSVLYLVKVNGTNGASSTGLNLMARALGWSGGYKLSSSVMTQPFLLRSGC